MTTALVLVAGGSGERARTPTSAEPKQFRPLGGVPVLAHALARFAAHPDIAVIQPVVRAGTQDRFREIAADLANVAPPVIGGDTRQASVRAGLEALAAFAPERVLIHDAVRPFPSVALIDRVLHALSAHDGVIPTLAVSDTLKRVAADGRIVETVARDGLYTAQTPQGFRFARILMAHRAATDAFTDDAAIAEAHGMEVVVVEGEHGNIKLTTPDDFARAEARLASARSGGEEMRVGAGYDVHRFGAGDHVSLCGVRIEFGRGLVGHSDADVGLHAITDALLGAIAEGDIGSHFPPSDPQWRGTDSAHFLAHAANLVAARGGRVVNVDVTLVCEAPKVGPHRDAMRARIAAILRIDPARVAVKATTSERLGFAGRREGIAAQATAAVALPAVSGATA